MSFNNYFNMEKLSIKIAENHILNMTENNYLIFDDGVCCFLDDEKLLNNMENGFVIITQINCFIESLLNTIISCCIGEKSNSKLHLPINKKVNYIFDHYKKDFSNVSSQTSWISYKKLRYIRNEMIHFKKVFVGESTGTPDFEFSGEKVGNFFTKHNMQKALENSIQLAHLLADSLDLKIYEDIGVFSCDGRDGLVNYIYDENLIEIDETRFI